MERSNRTPIKDEKGFTVTEVMIVAGIFLTIVLLGAQLYVSLTKAKAITNLKASAFLAVMKFTENIRYDASLYQVNWNNLTAVRDLKAAASATGYSSLPYGITNNTVIPIANCPTCTTRMGFVIIPHGYSRNLYEVHYEVYDTSTPGVRWGTSYYLTVK